MARVGIGYLLGGRLSLSRISREIADVEEGEAFLGFIQEK